MRSGRSCGVRSSSSPAGCGLPAGDFGALVGISRHTLYAWKKKFETEGPAGLADKPRGGPTGSRLPEVTRRAILMMKQDNPDWGCEKISAMLLRGPALPAGVHAVARVLHEAGYETEEGRTKPHIHRRWARSNASGERCGWNASRRLCVHVETLVSHR